MIAVAVDYRRVEAALERAEFAAGVVVGSWRTANAEAWHHALAFGRRQRTALLKRLGKDGPS